MTKAKASETLQPVDNIQPCFQYFAERDAELLAVVEPDGEQWTRARLVDLVNRLARAYLAAGLAEGEVMAIVAPNCAHYLAAYLAGVQVGLFVVPVNWHLRENELAFMLEDCGARVIVAHERLSPATLAAIVKHRGRADLLQSIGAAPGFTALTDFIAGHTVRPIQRAATGRLLAYTSATTGRPKGVKLPLANAQTALERFMAWHHSLGVALEDGNVHLCSSMLYHSAPLLAAAAALHMGHRVILVDQWQAQSLLELIDRHLVTTTFMVPSMFVRLLKLEESVRARYSTASLRFVMHAGAPCPVDVKRSMIEWWGAVIWETYGAAEGQGTMVSSEDWLRYPGTVGRPVPGSAIMILDGEGGELPANEVGTIYLRPYNGDRFEYKGDPDKTRRSYRGDFLTVGDLGYLNEDGYLFVCDREADLVISSGMNIYPAEIEAVLSQHPAVIDCAVLGVAHELLGAVPKAYVQAASGIETGPQLTAELLRFLGARLAAAKIPKRIEYVARVPRDLNGKLYKRLLLESASGDGDRAAPAPRK